MDAASSFASLSVASVLGTMGTLSGIVGGVCGSGGKLQTAGHGKKVQTCLWLSVTVVLCWAASLSCLAQLCLPFSPLPKQAEVPCCPQVQRAVEGAPGPGWGGVADLGQRAQPRSSVLSWQCPATLTSLLPSLLRSDAVAPNFP